MAIIQPVSGLTKILTELGATHCCDDIANWLRQRIDQINQDLAGTVLADISAFKESQNPEVLPQLQEHGPHHTAEIIRLLSERRIGDFEFVREHAAVRAEQHFPLEATLHAYRLGHRVFAAWLRKAALELMHSTEDQLQLVTALSDLTLEYTNCISTLLVDSYLQHTRLLSRLVSDQRTQLLRTLLKGTDESDPRVANQLRAAGYLKSRESWCLVTAQSADPAEMLSTDRAQRLAHALEQLLKNNSFNALVDIHDNRAVALVPDLHRLSGWTKAKTSINARIAPILKELGISVFAGISNDVGSISALPKAYNEALLALKLAELDRRIVRISELSFRDALLRSASPDLLLPQWTEEFRAVDQKSRGVYVETLRAYAAANMNVLKAAARLSIHPNTVYVRIQKIRNLTKLDPRSYAALTELLLVNDLNRL